MVFERRRIIDDNDNDDDAAKEEEAGIAATSLYLDMTAQKRIYAFGEHCLLT